MKKVMQVLLVLALVAAAIGYFRNWYTVTRIDEEQKTNINISIDRQRIRQDLDRAAEKAKKVTGEQPAAEDSSPVSP